THNIPVSRTSVVVLDPASGKPIAIANTDANGQFFLIVVEGNYNVNIIPPVSSGLAPKSEENVDVGIKSIMNVTLSSSSISPMQKLSGIFKFPLILLLICFAVFFVFISYVFLRGKI
ncbi:MAG: hypothetical protein KGJ07_08085, partial [Patescibacteria group bacterium]|nr:hypothetical protein [Patescibacteria group bacterium]